MIVTNLAFFYGNTVTHCHIQTMFKMYLIKDYFESLRNTPENRGLK